MHGRRRDQDLLPGVDGYVVWQAVGCGGSAGVYAALDVEAQTMVAVKVLAPVVGDYDSFQREGRLLGRLLAVPGVVRLQQVTFSREGHPVIVMDLVGGGTLADRISDATLACLDVIDIGIALADTLDQVHRLGIAHRDLKPANVLFDEGGRPVIADFGIACEDGRDHEMTAVEAMSPPYAPPERFRDEHDVDPRLGDIWSLASTLHTALTGTPPFGTTGDGGIVGLATRVVRGAVPSISRDDLPDGLESALRSALAADPADRPESMAAFADRLRMVREQSFLPEPGRAHAVRGASMSVNAGIGPPAGRAVPRVCPVTIGGRPRSGRSDGSRAVRLVALAVTATALLVGAGCTSRERSATSGALSERGTTLADLTDGRSVCALLDRDRLSTASGLDLGEPTPEDESPWVFGPAGHIGGSGSGAGCAFGPPNDPLVRVSIIPADLETLSREQDDDAIRFAGESAFVDVPGLGDALLEDAPWVYPCSPDVGCATVHGWARASYGRNGTTISVAVAFDGARAVDVAVPLARAVARQLPDR